MPKIEINAEKTSLMKGKKNKFSKEDISKEVFQDCFVKWCMNRGGEYSGSGKDQ